MRKEVQYAWLKTILKPLATAYTSFLGYRTNQIYECYLTGQTIQLQRLLNDTYDNTLRRIYIIHSLDSDIDLYLDSESQPASDLIFYLDSEAVPANDEDLYLDGEMGGALPVDFRVIAPTSLSGEVVIMTNLIRKYALIDKTFDIVFS